MNSYLFEIYTKESNNLLSTFNYQGSNAFEAFEDACCKNIHNYTGQPCIVIAVSGSSGVKYKFEIGN